MWQLWGPGGVLVPEAASAWLEGSALEQVMLMEG